MQFFMEHDYPGTARPMMNQAACTANENLPEKDFV
jgi:hypothetical protein